MQAEKNGIAHGAQGGYGLYTLVATDERPNGIAGVAVEFYNPGTKNVYITARSSDFGGASGWISGYEGPCRPPFVTATGTESAMLRDNAYHITQVVRAHTPNYSGSVFSATKLIAASGTTVVYNGANCSAG